MQRRIWATKHGVSTAKLLPFPKHKDSGNEKQHISHTYFSLHFNLLLLPFYNPPC